MRKQSEMSVFFCLYIDCKLMYMVFKVQKVILEFLIFFFRYLYTFIDGVTQFLQPFLNVSDIPCFSDNNMLWCCCSNSLIFSTVWAVRAPSFVTLSSFANIFILNTRQWWWWVREIKKRRSCVFSLHIL